jgi:hypothetical protein
MRSFPAASRSAIFLSNIQALADGWGLLGISRNIWVSLSGSHKGAKTVEQQVNELRFHSGVMISQIDQNGQLLFQNAHILEVIGFLMVASWIDHHNRQAYSRGARPSWLGASRTIQTI